MVPDNISTLSTSLSLAFIELSSILSTSQGGLINDISTLEQSTINNTSSIAGIQKNTTSSVTGLINVDRNLSNQIIILNNNFNVIANDLAVQVDAIYTSTVNWVESTIVGISTVSTFYNQISAVQSSINTSVSSLSTAISVGNTNLSNALTINYTAADVVVLNNANLYTTAQIQNLSAITVKIIPFNTFSTTITNQLLSTSAGLTTTIANTSTGINNFISTIFYSSIIPIQSTTVNNTKNISNLLYFSSQSYSTTVTLVSTFGSTLFYNQVGDILSQISTNSTNIGIVSEDLNNLSTFVSSFYTNYTQLSTTQSTQNYIYTSSIIDLTYNLNLLTSTSLISSIYNSFIQLETYTLSIINDILSTNSSFQQSLYVSTTIQNQSISQAFYASTVSSLYYDVLSTVIPSTQAYISSSVSSIMSTTTFVLLSTIQSTGTALGNNVISTTSSILQIYLSSSVSYMNSSILGYISTPTAILLSTFSTNSLVSISTFEYYAYSSLSSFNYTYNDLAASTYTLYTSSLDQYYLISSIAISSINYNSELLSTFSTQFGNQQSTQVSLFDSSIVWYTSTLYGSLDSTNTVVYVQTTSSATVTLNIIETSTNNAYSTFVANLNAAAPTEFYSSLFTNSTLTLTGNSNTAVMDLGTFRHYFINIYGIVDGNNYILDYNPTNLAALDYRKGIITIHVSTVGQAYTTYNGKLLFNVNRWGLPTTTSQNIIPYISSAAYTIQYEYTLINSIPYTNLLNVFPRILVKDPVMTALSTNIYVNFQIPATDSFLRGTPVQISWSALNFLPAAAQTTPPFMPDVEIDLIANNSVYGRYFCPFSQSTIVVNAPFFKTADYLSNITPNYPAGDPVFPTTARIFITGNPSEYIETSFNTIIPTFTNLQMNPSSILTHHFIGGRELVAVTEAGQYPFFSTPYDILVPPGAPSSYHGDLATQAANLFNGVLNSAGYLGASTVQIAYDNNTSIVNTFSEATTVYPDFYVNIPTYFNPLSTLQKFGSQITFTLRTDTTSYTFPAPNISAQPNGSYRIYNTSISKSGTSFGSTDIANINYSYSALNAISSVGNYTEYVFRGPTSTITTDVPPPYSIVVTDFPLPANDILSSITYYNLLDTPIGPTETSGTVLQASFLYANGSTFSTRLTTTAATSAQVFGL